MVPPALMDADARVLNLVANQDLLVHHPYESFDDTVLRMVREAVEDPNVLAIKMTLYRTGSASPFIPLLRQAAEAGKQVVCLVELKARFDEEENIVIAKQMEKVGVHVVYGFEELKTHTKTTLIVRREGERVRRYAHVGTGNYHSGTARLYVDLGLITSREDICADVADLFNHLTGRSKPSAYRKLLIAPATMKPQFLEMIRREIDHHQAGRPAHIIGKVNQLEDRDICRALYEASRHGVLIDLIVRGFNVIQPGVEGLSENIRLISVIGRFLEHSRIYYFRNGAEHEPDGEFYIGSADWMHRNQERRVEAVTPIEEPRLRAELWDILQIQLTDQRSAWDMQSDGTYIQRRPRDDDSGPSSKGTHQVLMERLQQRHKTT
jgi:polyphosphate kinase